MHGAQKLLGFPGNQQPQPLVSVAGVAGVIELVGGIMIAVGFGAGYAAFICSGQMAVAYFWRHHSGQAFWPIQNRGELAVLYCFIFIYIASRGSGILSIDSIFGRKVKH
jgi:putative oxidoreductase